MTMIKSQTARIYLLRHARAGWARAGERDFDRTLDDRGYGEAQAIASMMERGKYEPVVVLSSAATRCRQTTAIVTQSFGDNCETHFVDELYHGSTEFYLDMISTQDQKSVMLVGHNPVIEDTLSTLVGAEITASVIPEGYPTCGLAVLDFPERPDSLHWVLADFLAP